MQGRRHDRQSEVHDEIGQCGGRGAEILRHVADLVDRADCPDDRGKGGRSQRVAGVERALGPGAPDDEVAGEHPGRGGRGSNSWRQQQGGHDARQRAQADLLLEANLHRELLGENDGQKTSRNQQPVPLLAGLERSVRRGRDSRCEHETERRHCDDQRLQRPWEGREGWGHRPQLLGTSR